MKPEKNGDLFLAAIRTAKGDKKKEKEALIELFYGTGDDELKWWCALATVLVAAKLKEEMPK